MTRSRLHRQLPLRSLIRLALLAAAGPLAAQETQRDTTRRDSSRALPQVQVTAQRRSEPAQAVSVAITPLTARALAAQQVVQPNDLQRVVPGLEVEPAFGGGQPQFRLRGLGFNDYATNNTSTVAMYQDQVALPFPIQTQGLLFDLARVEVLRGPQGTLYGRNSTGGAINLISQRPTSTRQAGVQLDGGSFGQWQGEGYVSGALGAGWRARLATATQQGGAWQRARGTTTPLGDRDHSAMRAQLEYRSARAQWLFIGTASREQSENVGLQLFAPLATRGGEGPTISPDDARRSTGWGLRPEFARIVGTAPGVRPGRDGRGAGLSVEGRLQLGALQLTTVSAYQGMQRFEVADWDATTSAESDVAFRSRVRVASQELRLAPAVPGLTDWVLGAYVARETLNERFHSDFTDVPGLGAVALTAYGQRADATSLFGQVRREFVPQWTVVAGARVEYEARQLNGLTTGFVEPAVTFVPPTDSRLYTTQPAGKLALERRFARDVLTYLSLSRGIKSGGFTAYNTTNPAQLAAFRPEVLDAVELGVKADPTSTLRVNAALFRYAYRDQQVLSTVYDSVSRGPIGRIANAARSTINGVEADITWQPVRWFEWQQFAAWRAGRYDRFTTIDAQASLATGAPVARDFSGTWLNIPRWSLGGSAISRVQTGRIAWEGTLSWSRRDVQEASRLIFTPEYDVPAYTLLNATIEARPVGSAWSIALWGRNITDTRYELTRNFFINARVSSPGAPAMGGVRVRWERGGR